MVQTGQQRVRVDRGWISVYTRDGTQLLDRVIPFGGSAADAREDEAAEDGQPDAASAWAAVSLSVCTRRRRELR